MTVKNLFGKTLCGEDVFSYKITNSKGEYVTILSLGATVYRICVRDGCGNLRDVALGYGSVREYETGDTYFGALVGRVAGRISGCGTVIDGQRFTFPDTGGGVTLHGGVKGFNLKHFTVQGPDPSSSSMTLKTFSPDGDQGFPGNLSLSVTYTFTDDSALIIEYTASSDAKTPVNLTNHSYFNLCGADSGKNIYDTELTILGDRVTPLGSDFTPSGDVCGVSGTAFDFTRFKPIGKDIEKDDPQLILAGGYDINYVLGGDLKDRGRFLPAAFQKDAFPDVSLAAVAYSRESKIVLAVFTDRPCVQFYSGNFLTGLTGKDGAPYSRRCGFCLETQGYPDAENKSFPGNLFAAGEIFRSKTVYAFGLMK
ncbi:MAG: galactose mutarotase [Clostridia bacterium]|nr:galactose mutarotase [Clostridia bacterium]